MVPSGWRQLLRNDYYRARKAKRRAHDRCAATLQVVAPSRWLVERLGTQELGRFRRHHIPNGVDSEHFKFVPGARAEFGLPERQPIVLFLAWNPTYDLEHRKGLPTVAAAFERHVFPAAPDTILAVAGEAYAPNHPNVRPLGRISRERLPRLYSTVNMYVTATVADNLPYTILEAMACGLPVVATNVGGIPELVTDGESGLLVPPADPDVLGAAILHLLRDPDLASRMGKEGRGRVEREFTMAKFVSAYERLFEEMSKPHAMN
jgi:glycosyltransferase involved in cell wall biosynthesis